jgi:hypothetical protein
MANKYSGYPRSRKMQNCTSRVYRCPRTFFPIHGLPSDRRACGAPGGAIGPLLACSLKHDMASPVARRISVIEAEERYVIVHRRSAEMAGVG